MSIQQAIERAAAVNVYLNQATKQTLPEYHNAYVVLLEDAHRQALLCAQEIGTVLASLSMKGLDE